MKRLLLLFAVAIVASCSNKADNLDNSTTTTEADTKVIFTASIYSNTRVANDKFEEGDAIVVSAFEDGSTFASQITYTYLSDTFTSTNPITRTSETQLLSYIAAYPSTISNFGKSFAFTVLSDQSAGDNLEMSDLLVAIEEASTSTTPVLTLYHALSSLVINFVFTGDDAEAAEEGTLTIYGQTTTNIDLSGDSYSATAAGNIAGLTPADNSTIIFAPQSIDAGEVVAIYTVGDKSYTWTPNNDLTFNSGVRYTYTWTIDTDNSEDGYNGEISYNGIISDWNDKDLYDNWSVIFVLDGGEIDSSTADIKVEVEDGKLVANPGTPQKDGYTFKSWVDSEGVAFDFDTTTIEAHTTITATWASGYDYVVYDEADLTAFRTAVNAGTATTANVILANDITLSESNWTPIGTSSNPFIGTFDGNNKTIYGLTISASTAYQGLFGALGGGATIQNCTISDLNISTSYNSTTASGTYGTIGAFAGGVVSSADYVYLTNLTVADGTITGGCMVGGIIGATSGYNALTTGLAAIITDCVIESDVTITKTGSGNYVGGITSTVKQYSVITNCQNRGAVVSTGGSVNGGVLGGGQDSYIIGCSNVGSMTSSSNAYGGIMGTPGQNMIFIGCYNTGVVSGEGTSSNGGGIGGQLQASGVKLYACYGAGTVTGAAAVGQLLGNFTSFAAVSGDNLLATIADCFSIGTAIGSDSSSGGYADYYKELETIAELNAAVSTMNANAELSKYNYKYQAGDDDNTPPTIVATTQQ